MARRRRTAWLRVPGPRWAWLSAVAIALLIVALLVAPNLSPFSWFGAAPGSGPVPVVNATISMGPEVGVHPADPFFAIVFTDSGEPTPSLVSMGAFFNSTPITVFRFGGVGDGYDPTTQTLYAPPPAGGTYLATYTGPIEWNLSWMKAWCDSRVPQCSWLGYLPGELNNPAAAVHTAEWYHDVLGFVPTMWQFGNEPQGWTHFGENRTVWSTVDRSVPSGPGYATMVLSYLTAVHGLFPGDEFVGIESADPGAAGGYVADTAQLAGSSLAAMAYHSYPLPASGGDALGQFYGSLTGASNVTTTTSEFRAALAQGCGACGDLPVQIGEYQAGPPLALSSLSATYAGAPFLAASIIEALRANVSMFTPFDSSRLVDGATGAVLPQGLLYQRILENMTMGADFATTLTAPGVGGLFSILLENGPRESLLIVNTATTAALRLTIPTSVFPVGSVGSYWSWNSSAPVPTAVRSTLLPDTFLVPEQGILLLDNY